MGSWRTFQKRRCIHSDTDAHARSSDTNAESDFHANCERDTHPYPDSHSYRNRDSDSDTNDHGNAESDPDTNDLSE